MFVRRAENIRHHELGCAPRLYMEDSFVQLYVAVIGGRTSWGAVVRVSLGVAMKWGVPRLLGPAVDARQLICNKRTGNQVRETISQLWD